MGSGMNRNTQLFQKFNNVRYSAKQWKFRGVETPALL